MEPTPNDLVTASVQQAADPATSGARSTTVQLLALLLRGRLSVAGVGQGVEAF